MLRVLGAFALWQIGLRLWLRIRPGPIPFGWSWLLENPWRRVYRSPERTATLCGLLPTDTVLELGCGSGLFTRELAARCARLIASDLNPKYLRQTRERSGNAGNIDYLCADARRLPLRSASVDVVVLISTLSEIPRPVAALLECRRVLKPGGRIVISEELFAPEYVPVRVTAGWAAQAGLSRERFAGTVWVYFCQYICA
ncbi:class I SAM-dependent methyltransferase [Deinococcus altitudinis]|uniref:class I SAM-dependent methyltransferase n=1 Tax=Deinococcus altitudinis TaxID=468914 RepID=UPI0038913A14